MKLMVDMDTNHIYTEQELRRIYLEEETQDILRNSTDYVNDILDISTQAAYLNLAVYGNIKDIVRNLNESWNYNIRIFVEENEK